MVDVKANAVERLKEVTNRRSRGHGGGEGEERTVRQRRWAEAETRKIGKRRTTWLIGSVQGKYHTHMWWNDETLFGNIMGKW